MLAEFDLHQGPALGLGEERMLQHSSVSGKEYGNFVPELGEGTGEGSDRVSQASGLGKGKQLAGCMGYLHGVNT
jgi:hypothetical protein